MKSEHVIGRRQAKSLLYWPNIKTFKEQNVNLDSKWVVVAYWVQSILQISVIYSESKKIEIKMMKKQLRIASISSYAYWFYSLIPCANIFMSLQVWPHLRFKCFLAISLIDIVHNPLQSVCLQSIWWCHLIAINLLASSFLLSVFWLIYNKIISITLLE